MAKMQRATTTDADVMLDGEALEQLDHDTVEMLQDYTDFGLRCLVSSVGIGSP
jgi:hypothetical protein